MVDLAHALDLTVIAEGVETEEQLLGLRELHCDVVQGHHYYRARAASESDDLIVEPAPVTVPGTPASLLAGAAVRPGQRAAGVELGGLSNRLHYFSQVFEDTSREI